MSGILADQDILLFRSLGQLDIHPFDHDLLQPASYDVRLAPYVTKRWTIRDEENGVLVTRHEWITDKFDEDPEGLLTYTLEPGEFALFSTIEIVEVTPTIGAEVKGKSTWAREGLIIESAGWVDPGFCGQLTLELKNIGGIPLVLTAGKPIAQVVFHELRSRAMRPYGERGRYMNQHGPTEPRPAAGDE